MKMSLSFRPRSGRVNGGLVMALRHLRFIIYVCIIIQLFAIIKPSWSALIARWGGCRHAPAPLRCARALRIRHPTLRFGGEEIDSL